MHAFSRTEIIIGEQGLQRLAGAKVAIFGVGGVGSYVAEALVRAGVGKFILVDDDTICLTNTNRQLHTTRKTIGQPKVEAMRQRMLDINPAAVIETIQSFYLPEKAEQLIQDDYDYIVDALDTVTAKIDLAVQGKERSIPVISAMGAGNKLDPGGFKVADLAKTSVCPLAKVMRKELRKRGVEHLKVVYSEEKPIVPICVEASDCSKHCICPPGSTKHCLERRSVPGSISFVPGVVGLLIAGAVVNDLLAAEGK